jgi:hypothetical protein
LKSLLVLLCFPRLFYFLFLRRDYYLEYYSQKNSIFLGRVYFTSNLNSNYYVYWNFIIINNLYYYWSKVKENLERKEDLL